MINPFKEVNWNPGSDDLRKFSRSLIVGFPLIAGLLLLLGRLTGHGWRWQHAVALAGLGVALGIVLWIAPMLTRPIYYGWHFLSCCVGLVVGNLLLAIIYCFFFSGFGLPCRIFGRKVFRKKLDRTTPTYWRDSRPNQDLRRYYNQF